MENNQNDDNVVKVNLQDLAQAKDDAAENTTHKVDLSKPPVDAPVEEVIEDTPVVVVTEESDADPEELTPEGDDSPLNEDHDSALVEITDEDESDDEDLPHHQINDSEDPVDDGPTLPENVQKLIEFMNDTGGDINDYVKLNTDVDSLSETDLLREYHQALEPSLDADEINFLMEDLYSSDEDLDDEREIKKKGITRKRDLSKAKKHLQGLKDKYYDEIKAGSKLTPEQKKAVDFFGRYTQENKEKTKTVAKRSEIFTQKSNMVFGEEFKGFEFKVGEKKYRYNVKDAAAVKEAQSDINNFAKKYLGDDNTLSDAKGYHKALFTAMNPDAIANHFYQQGKADQVKASAKNAKNINMDPRGTHDKSVPNAKGFSARVVDSDNTAPGKLRIKRR